MFLIILFQWCENKILKTDYLDIDFAVSGKVGIL